MKANPTLQPTPKAWLREAVRDLLPDFVMNRPKTGFNAPWRRWTAALMERYGDQIADGELVRAGLIERGLSPERAGFAILTLEIWCRQMRAAADAAARRDRPVTARV